MLRFAVFFLFTTLPALPVQAEIIGQSQSGSGSSEGSDTSVTQACDSAFIARLSLASMYGNCDAPEAAKGGGVPADSMCQSTASKQSETLSQVWNSGGSCPKPYAQKPKYSQAGARMTVNGDKIDPAPGGQTDCSGFVSGVEARLGHRFESGKDITAPTTTEAMVKLLDNGSSCFEKISGELLPGDMVVYNENGKGHVYLIDRISSGGPGGCDFSLIESSGGSDAEFGGPRVVVKGGAEGGAPVSDAMGSAVKGMSKSCVAKDGKDVKVGRFNPNKPGCKGTPKQFANESCVKNCPDLGRRSEACGS